MPQRPYRPSAWAYLVVAALPYRCVPTGWTVGDSWPLWRGKVGLRGKLRAVPDREDQDQHASLVDAVEKTVRLDEHLANRKRCILGNKVAAARERAKPPKCLADPLRKAPTAAASTSEPEPSASRCRSPATSQPPRAASSSPKACATSAPCRSPSACPSKRVVASTIRRPLRFPTAQPAASRHRAPLHPR